MSNITNQVIQKRRNTEKIRHKIKNIIDSDKTSRRKINEIMLIFEPEERIKNEIVGLINVVKMDYGIHDEFEVINLIREVITEMLNDTIMVGKKQEIKRRLMDD